MTTTVLNTKIKKTDNKVPDLSGLVKKTDHRCWNIREIKGKYFTTTNNKFTSDLLDAMIKQEK